ncbi:hypothetical protein H0O02_05245 [Candidatus Micrarchaeota archaeon]|nr:hypothetical protein [Candidatus Micrarchaeota archaeon]
MHMCPKCGKTEKEKQFLEAFCIDCYPFSFRIPDVVEIETCKRCGRMRIRGEWVSFDKKGMDEYIAGKCKGEFESVTYDSGKQQAFFTVKKCGTSVTVPRYIEFIKKITICQDCSRMAGGYVEAIVQLRGNEQAIAKYSKMLIRMLKAKSFITKTEETHGGMDLFVGSTRSVLESCGALGLHAMITKKLMGRREGRRYYRTTFSIRFED